MSPTHKLTPAALSMLEDLVRDHGVDEVCYMVQSIGIRTGDSPAWINWEEEKEELLGEIEELKYDNKCMQDDLEKFEFMKDKIDRVRKEIENLEKTAKSSIEYIESIMEEV